MLEEEDGLYLMGGPHTLPKLVSTGTLYTSRYRGKTNIYIYTHIYKQSKDIVDDGEVDDAPSSLPR
jgi:hypothetical protein